MLQLDMRESGNKTLAKDHMFTRKMIDSVEGSRIICGNVQSKMQRKVAKQIKFLRNLGLLPTTHTQIVVDLN